MECIAKGRKVSRGYPMDIPKKVHVGLLTRHGADRFHFNGQRCLIPAARPPLHLDRCPKN